MGVSSDILAAIGRAVSSHVGTILDLSDETKIFYSLQDSSNWCKDYSELPAVVIVSQIPNIDKMMIALNVVNQEFTIYLYNRSVLSDSATSLELAQYDNDILSELRAIVNDIMYRQFEGIETTDILVTDVRQTVERNHTGAEDGVQTVTQYTTTFTIQFDEVL